MGFRKPRCEDLRLIVFEQAYDEIIVVTGEEHADDCRAGKAGERALAPAFRRGGEMTQIICTIQPAERATENGLEPSSSVARFAGWTHPD